MGAAAGAVVEELAVRLGRRLPGGRLMARAGLAAADVNITDLQTQMGGSVEEPICMMLLEVEVGEVDVEALKAGLREIAARAAVEIELRPLAAETF